MITASLDTMMSKHLGSAAEKNAICRSIQSSLQSVLLAIPGQGSARKFTCQITQPTAAATRSRVPAVASPTAFAQSKAAFKSICEA